MNFKESVLNDIATLINEDEFAEKVSINDSLYTVVIDNDRLSTRQSKDMQGLLDGDTLFFIAESEGYEPIVGNAIKFNKKNSVITNVKLDSGMYEVVLAFRQR